MAMADGDPGKQAGQSHTLTKSGWVISAASPPTHSHGGGSVVQTDNVQIICSNHAGDGHIRDLIIVCIETGDHKPALCSPTPFGHKVAGTYTYRSQTGTGTACNTSLPFTYSAGVQTGSGFPITISVTR